jgi:hypothetical protein
VDPEPQITSVVPDRPWQPGETVTVTLNGKGFGSNPRVSLRSSDGDTVACLGSEEVTIVGPAAGVARDTQIVFTKTVPSNSPGCAFEIGVVTSGISGQFYPGPGGGDRVQHATRTGTVMRPAPGRLVTFIVHGLSDSSASFQSLRDNLEDQDGWKSKNGVEPLRVVDASFTFDGCYPIERGAEKLASHVGKFIFRSGDRIAFITHSMGGLMVRRMLADGLLNVGIPVVGLVTLGTPHLGYPYISFDDAVQCASQVQQMNSRLVDSNPLLNSGTMSPFLQDLFRRWNPAQVGYRWFAAGGAFCAAERRYPPGTYPDPRWPNLEYNGCRNANVLSDGVVCLDSAIATYPQGPQGMPAPLQPTVVFADPWRMFGHTKIVGFGPVSVLCGNPAVGPYYNLADPPPGPPTGSQQPAPAVELFLRIVAFLYAL